MSNKIIDEFPRLNKNKKIKNKTGKEEKKTFSFFYIINTRCLVLYLGTRFVSCSVYWFVIMSVINYSIVTNYKPIILRVVIVSFTGCRRIMFYFWFIIDTRYSLVKPIVQVYLNTIVFSHRLNKFFEKGVKKCSNALVFNTISYVFIYFVWHEKKPHNTLLHFKL